MSRQRANDGFTLIELVLALSLMGLLTAASLGAWRIGVSAQEKVIRIATSSRRNSAVADFVIAQAAAVVPIRLRVNQGPAALAFSGTSSSMVLVSRYSLAQRTRGGLVLAAYQISGEQGQESLMYSERRISSQRDLNLLLIAGAAEGQSIPFGSLAASLGDTAWITVMDFSNGRFEYFGRAQADHAPRWEQSWDSSSGKLPLGIAIRFARGDRQSAEIPQTIAAPVNSFENRERPLPLYLY